MDNAFLPHAAEWPALLRSKDAMRIATGSGNGRGSISVDVDGESRREPKVRHACQPLRVASAQPSSIG
jgi:hypothetical protein